MAWPKLNPEAVDRLVEDYARRKPDGAYVESVTSIARRFEISKYTLHRYINGRGIPTRSHEMAIRERETRVPQERRAQSARAEPSGRTVEPLPSPPPATAYEDILRAAAGAKIQLLQALLRVRLLELTLRNNGVPIPPGEALSSLEEVLQPH